jgi:hypothetical protein
MATIIISLMFCLSLFLSSIPAHSAVFNVASGDVTGLIAAINAANSNGEENTIILEAGTYTLTAVNFTDTNGSTGLPSVTSTQTIQGAGATIIQRDNSAPVFRIFHVAVSGILTLDRLTIRGGTLGAVSRGGAILNQGTLTVGHSIIAHNGGGSSFSEGGGLFNDGTAIIAHTTVTSNSTGQGGGLYNTGTVSIDNSTFTGNGGGRVAGGLINIGSLIINNSTFARNFALFGPGAISNGGQGIITNSTIVDNSADFQFAAGGISSNGGLELQNTILAHNDAVIPDCSGTIISLGNNIIGTPSGCTITLQPSDLTGDPGLGDFIDDGTPGGGRFPLLAGSPAINAGNNGACPATDQLDTPRNGPCDIGAIEFYPVVNDLVAVGNLSTAVNPTPVPGGPAGTFRITAEFTNTSNQVIVNPFVEVVELTGGNLLLNADGGAGGVGARLTPTDSVTTPFHPGASSTVEFLIGLQQQEPFTFFVNMLGEPRTSNPSLSKR